MKNITIRNCPDALSQALSIEVKRRSKSLNSTVIDLLCQALGVHTDRQNGLGRLAGTWSSEDYAQFESATAALAEIDEDLWR